MPWLRGAHIFKLIVYGIFLYVTTVVFIFGLSSWNKGNSGDSSLTYYLARSIPPQWQDICQFLEHTVTGQEAVVKDSSLKLRGIAVVFRHGERSPLIEEDDETGCTPTREEDRRNFEVYRNLIFSEDFQYFLRVHKRHQDYPKVPHRSRCSMGEMTAEGALQLSKLGYFFHEQYKNTALFNSDSRLDVGVTASLYHRTFQSAIAFSSTFLYPHKSSLPQIFIKPANDSFLCTSEVCSCPSGLKWRHKLEDELLGVFRRSAPAFLRDQTEKVRKLSSFQSIEDEPLKIMDIALGRYVCRRRSLPCKDRDCLTYEYLSQLLNYTTARGTYVFAEERRFIAKKLLLVEAYGVLYHLRDAILRIQRFPHTNVIRIFSGHDTTVGPVLRVLGIPFVDFPRYASRISFEMYETESGSSSNILIRVLYNEKDVTPQVYFCRNLVNGLCPAEYFDQFIKTDILSMLGTKSVPAFCKDK